MRLRTRHLFVTLLVLALAGCYPQLPSSDFVGVWVSTDGTSRVELSADGAAHLTSIPDSVLNYIAPKDGEYERLDLDGVWEIEGQDSEGRQVVAVDTRDDPESPILGVGFRVDSRADPILLRIPLGDPDSNDFYDFTQME